MAELIIARAREGGEGAVSLLNGSGYDGQESAQQARDRPGGKEGGREGGKEGGREG